MTMHRVVTLVADKLEKQWLCIVYFANCINNQRGSFLDHDLVDIVTLCDRVTSFYQKHHIFEVQL